jgi:tetratricopeptide (TPR) repeat protein
MADLQSQEDEAHNISKQGKYAEAEAILRSVLSQRLSTPDSDPEDVIRAKNNLAACLNSQYKDLSYAESIQLEVVEADRKLYGTEHPHTLSDLNNLAQIYMHQGRFEKAVEIQRETLDTSERVLGAEHEDTLRLKENMANTLKKQADEAGKAGEPDRSG